MGKGGREVTTASPTFLTYDLEPSWAPKIVEAPKFTVATLRAIDRAWQENAAAQLFDGQLFCCVHSQAPLLAIASLPYRIWWAARHHPDLFEGFLPQAVAITGVCHREGNLLMGRRSESVGDDRGLWELAPAGGLDPTLADGGCLLHRQLVAELREEVGIEADTLLKSTPRWLVYDREKLLWDVVCLAPLCHQVPAHLSSTEEYCELKLSAMDELPKPLAPLTHHIVSNLLPSALCGW